MQEYRADTFIVRYDPDIGTHAANCVAACRPCSTWPASRG